MDHSAFLFDNLPQSQENHEQNQEDCHQFKSKLNYNKSLFRTQSLEPSIYGDFFSNQNDQSFDIELDQFKLPNEKMNRISKEKIQRLPKKVIKIQKLNKKKQTQNGPLSQNEFIDILKKLDQCQYLMNMIDNMTLTLNRFLCQLHLSRNERILK